MNVAMKPACLLSSLTLFFNMKLVFQVKDRVDKNLVKENDNIRKYMQQMKVGDGEDHE